MPKKPLLLVLQCLDAPGIIAAVTSFIADAGATIIESGHFVDQISSRLNLRISFSSGGADIDVEKTRSQFATVAALFDMKWRLYDGEDVGTIIMVSRFGHCLFDLIHEWQAGLLPIRIDAVISNHETHRSFVDWAGIPFHYLPVTPGTKIESERRLVGLIETYNSELLVLARYMQVLSPELCAAMEQRCINIHHGFLPSFKGAKPYHQAFARGVKVAGATAHFVTTDLDEGPIIEQDTVRVDHSLGPDDLIAAGRDIESSTLRRAVLSYAQRRIVMDGSKTVIFR